MMFIELLCNKKKKRGNGSLQSDCMWAIISTYHMKHKVLCRWMRIEATTIKNHLLYIYKHSIS